MMTFALAVGVLTFRFPGGSGPALLSMIEQQSHQPIVFLSGRHQIWPRSNFTYTNASDLKKGLRRTLGLIPVPQTFGVMERAWPNEDVLSAYVHHFPIPGEAPNAVWPDKPNIDGTITLRSTEKLFRVADIPAQLFGKPVKVHRLFQKMQVAASAENVAPKKLLEALAVSIGAKLEDKEDGWDLSVDIKQYRSRMVATLRNRAELSLRGSSDPVNAADAELCAQALASLSDQDLLRAVNGDASSFVIDVSPGSPLMSSTVQRIAVFKNRKDIVNDGADGAATVRQVAGMLDLNRPLKIVLDPFVGKVSVRGWVKGQPTAGVQF